MRWSIVVPVKSAALGKTRLDPREDRPALARAVALDTIAAAAAADSVERVLVVSGDPLDARVLPPGVSVLADPGRGLLAAIRAGLAHPGSTPAVGEGIAVLLGDLPALRPAELDAALAAAARHPLAMVRDAEGTGTTLLTARGVRLEPRFGPGSAAAHAALGHVAVDETAGPGLRRDLDTAEDLAALVGLGVGPATAAVLAPAR
ncbi:2-phospho-L-lactate guanylyltransferase [Homoserinibacter sp. YIM 151385]|uniref:2-phospho-L-lactate guanylyltransferase n=1 Tax=Homoserinibacter sp. YIM 151385 TaxID=2985506 RepID=UPI0022F10272|nr:2-phospho-L-lactate guanylyltransferase [Homoserinibacter sp. YIM 151385]WBU39197.1 2-phospho-L-lactate guanylyltransferase [Homoserinibacter sp. YIM 151385]